MSAKPGCTMCDLVTAFKSGGEEGVRRAAEGGAAESRARARGAVVMGARGVHPDAMRQAPSTLHVASMTGRSTPMMPARGGGGGFGASAGAGAGYAASAFASSREGDRVSGRELSGMDANDMASMLYGGGASSRAVRFGAGRGSESFVGVHDAAEAVSPMTAPSGMFIPM